MKIWILASVASFVLLGGGVWGMDTASKDTEEMRGDKKKPENTKKDSAAAVTEDNFAEMLSKASITPENKVLEIKEKHLSLVAAAAADAREEGIRSYCPNLRQAKDNDLIKMIIDHSAKMRKKVLAKSKTLDRKGKKIQGKDGDSKTNMENMIDKPGVKYFSGLRRRFNGVFKLLDEQHVSEWDGIVIANNMKLSYQALIDENDKIYMDQYWVKEGEKLIYEGKVYLYDTFNIAGIDLWAFLNKIDFSLKKDEKASKGKIAGNTWQDLPLRKNQSAMLICDVPVKTDCYKLEGWKKNIRGCKFTKINRCLTQAQEPKSQWLTDMLGEYFDYFVARSSEQGRVKKPGDLSNAMKLRLFTEFSAKSMNRFFAYDNSNEENLIITDTNNSAYKTKREAFCNDANIRRNAVSALLLDEASKRHIDQSKKLYDKKFLEEQLDLLLKDAGEVIAQIQYKRQAVNGMIGNVFGLGDMDSISHQVLKKIVKEEVKKLHDADNAKTKPKDAASQKQSSKTPTEEEA